VIASFFSQKLQPGLSYNLVISRLPNYIIFEIETETTYIVEQGNRYSQIYRNMNWHTRGMNLQQTKSGN